MEILLLFRRECIVGELYSTIVALATKDRVSRPIR